jgi:hypothetical protein
MSTYQEVMKSPLCFLNAELLLHIPNMSKYLDTDWQFDSLTCSAISLHKMVRQYFKNTIMQQVDENKY